MPTATMQRRALLVGELEREVLADPRRRHRLEPEPEPAEPRGAGRLAVRVRVDDELGAGAQRAVGDGVEVPDDHVRGEPHLAQRVGAAVDRDEHRAEVADVRPHHPQVGLVARPARDDERVPVAEPRAERR